MELRRVITLALPLTVLIACSETDEAYSRAEAPSLDGVRQQVDTMFQTIDVNQNDELTYQELLESNLSFNSPLTGQSLQGEAAAHAWVDTFDLNRDGVIARAELLTGIEQMLETRS